MCVEFIDATSPNVGNGFPWENETLFFSTFRNQFLFSSSDVNAVKSVAVTIESIGARSVSFTGANVNVYGSVNNGSPSAIVVSDNIGDTLVPQFAANGGPLEHCRIEGTDAAPIVINTRVGPKGALISACDSCASPDEWCVIGDLRLPATLGSNGNLLVDHELAVSTGNSGAGVWDTNGNGNCATGSSRAYGSGQFANVNHLTTALGVDEFGFIWVFKGLRPPPPATVEQQIKEIVRLLLTPEGLRCSGLDLTPDNDIIEDDPITFPNGANIDPIQPSISTGGQKTGDEAVDGLRSCGWSCN
jgi:hypothetical protein